MKLYSGKKDFGKADLPDRKNFTFSALDNKTPAAKIQPFIWEFEKLLRGKFGNFAFRPITQRFYIIIAQRRVAVYP